jgi:glycosyltransferase involved in cell wall biosynthesis
MFELSIIIPAYNEEDRLPPTLREILSWKNCQTVFQVEIIIVDDGSIDKTSAIVQEFQKVDNSIKLIQERHVGFMHAIISGFKATNYSLVGHMEADCATHPREFENLLKYIGDYDMIMGSRILRGDLGKIKNKSFFRRLLSFFMSLFFRLLFKGGIYDPQIGFKLYKKNVLTRIIPKLCLENDGLRNSEMVVKTYGLGFKIKEVPVDYVHEEASRCVPKKPLRFLVTTVLSLFSLWVQSRIEFQKGLYRRNPVRFPWVADLIITVFPLKFIVSQRSYL